MARITPSIVGLATSAGPTSGTSSERSITFQVPGGFQKGDLLVAAITHNATANMPDMTSSGWFRLGMQKPSSGEGRITGFWGFPVTNPALVPPEVVFRSDAVNHYRYVGVLAIVRGADLNDIVSGYSNSYPGVPLSSGAETVPFAVDAPSLVFVLGANENVSGNASFPIQTPPGYSELGKHASSTVMNETRTSIWVGTRTATEGEAIPAATFAWQGISGPRAQAIGIRGRQESDGGGTPGEPTDVILQFRRGTSGEVLASSYILEEGEPGYDKTNKVLKIGDGVSTWANLPGIGGGVIVVPNINNIPPGTPAGAIIFQEG